MAHGILNDLFSGHVQLFCYVVSVSRTILRFINVGMSASPHFTKWPLSGSVFPRHCL